MPALAVLVDFDNVEASLKRAGPVSLAKALVAVISAPINEFQCTLACYQAHSWHALLVGQPKPDVPP